MNQGQFGWVKRTAIRAVFSDDELLEQLVLKGGNAIDIVYGLSTRGSVDLDFSVAGDLGDPELLRNRIERVLRTEFSEHGHEVFDVLLEEVPSQLSADLKDFWGGYQISFKLIEKTLLKQLGGKLEDIRRNAAAIGGGGSTKFEIDISKHEYCDGKLSTTLDSLKIYVYSPEMIVCEKLRAICQQTPEYAAIVHRRRTTARARDFFDIALVSKARDVDFGNSTFRETLSRMFEAKRVPLKILGELELFREFHRADFAAVRATVKSNIEVLEFDYYFDWVLEEVKKLETFWHE